jgi:hypothetical protein
MHYAVWVIKQRMSYEYASEPGLNPVAAWQVSMWFFKTNQSAVFMW